jgi:hypothetical protein
MDAPPVVPALATRLVALDWVTDLWVAGSLATGDHVPGVSDLDLVAVVDGPVDTARTAALIPLHRELDAGVGSGAKLGCVYVDAATALDPDALHPTGTHGRLVQRILSGITRAELVRHGVVLFGRPPGALLPPMTADDVRRASHAELTGYWASAARRPWWCLHPAFADLALTSMARGRYALTTGDLLSKTAAVEQAAAPAWLVGDLRRRRQGEQVTSPRLRTALVAWVDVLRTVTAARRWRRAS